MARNLIISFLLIFTIGIFSSCKTKNSEKLNPEITMEEDIIPVQELRQIFYHMYLPDEMSRLFERVGANYDPEITNPPDNFSRYNDDNKISIAIGIYGVDLGYSRLFDQTLATAGYLSSIKILSEKLGIPKNYFDDIYRRIEDQISNQDSVARITTDLYTRTDAFLKENGKDSQAALIVMGGWIEALFIATKILESNSNNIEIMDRIAEQKYSLNSLLSLLNNYQDDIYIAENILLLKKLKRVFDKFEIYYEQDSFVVDTISKTISTSGYNSGLTPDIAKEIRRVISDIRTILIL